MDTSTSRRSLRGSDFRLILQLFSYKQMRLRLLRFLAAFALTPALAGSVLGGPTAAPPPGVLLLDPLNAPGRVCLGESAAVDVLVTDAVYGAPLGGATLALSSALGGTDTAWSPGGVVRLHYQPRLEGSDTILITATAPNSTSGLASLPVSVSRCRWTWDLFYTGTYPHPEGFWKFVEQATVAAGTLETVAGGSTLSGSGTVSYSISAHGEVPDVSCDFRQLTGGTAVKVSGTIGQPAGSMTLEFTFDPAPITGDASFHCRIASDRISFVIPVSEVSAALSSLPLQSVIVPTAFGLISRPVSSAIFWLVPGSGRLTLVVTTEPVG
ncbi:MAG TPA: hypothetical protein VFI11_03800 [Anaerolineales bacterium]|nr:hypothetical protein [Anaerolineales bacterium]